MKQSTSKTAEVGAKGEDLAAKFLINKGFSIICRNYWKKWGEIDIVAKKGNDLHFVEVKSVTRSNVSRLTSFDGYEPEDNIHPWKRQRLSRVIQTYLDEKDIDEDIDWQFDVVSVYLDPKGELLKIEYLDDVEL